ncbi:MAG: type VI secretion system-associated FHA domain protein TagH [Gammaproteobacteria bacterium HGW-Gammaproteobacteria-1]|jgi:type VI secretion system FHA domain protein|nr:MAG: type VI secretion system-associated FHA domain protein TagH [Gammaproteobacteria bacterium HGW-Gammaproteobacteria-1]
MGSGSECVSIEISIVRSPKHVQHTKTSHCFATQGGSLGRGPDNAWVLEDPERFISTRHSQIVYENGRYYLADLSTNGTFYNGAAEPIGNGNRVPLKDGDRFSLSDYEFEVRERADGSAAGMPEDDPFALNGFAGHSSMDDADLSGFASSYVGSDPFANPVAAPLPALGSLIEPDYAETDPLAVLDRVGQPSQANPFLEPFAPSQPDNADPMQQAMAWPSAIPEDWDNELGGHEPPVAPVSAPPAQAPFNAADSNTLEMLRMAEEKCEALETENRALLAEITQLRQKLKNVGQTTAPKAVERRVHETDESLIEVMGLGGWDLSEAKRLEVSNIAGQIVRETLIGLMQALSFRKKIKEEFRINVTTIQPVENNPLKFSANLEDALENMFVRENKAYMRPLDAVREGFQGISEHQVAVLSGIQAAFRGMIERFDPDSLEKRFEKYRKAGVIKVGQKSKNWDSYREFHQDLVNNLDNSFQHLFGYDFMQAYEDQLQRLVMSRRAKAKAKS